MSPVVVVVIGVVALAVVGALVVLAQRKRRAGVVQAGRADGPTGAGSAR